MSWLAANCPRLAQARDSYLVALAAESRRQVQLARAISDLERLVAHRDLHLVRSEAKRTARADEKYMAFRQRKLAVARRRLAELRAEFDHLDDWRRAA